MTFLQAFITEAADEINGSSIQRTTDEVQIEKTILTLKSQISFLNDQIQKKNEEINLILGGIY